MLKTVIEEFNQGFIEYLNENPEEKDIFEWAYRNADNNTLKDIVMEYIDGLEVQGI